MTKHSAPRYVLGTSTHLFTDLPKFRSGMEAINYVRTHRMNGVVYVHEERDLSAHGVIYGISRQIVATAQNKI